MITTLIIFALGVLATWLGQFSYKRILPKLEKTHHVWDIALIKAARLPYFTFVWLIAFSILIPIVFLEFSLDIGINKYVSPLREILFLAAMMWFAIRFIDNLEEGYIERATSADLRRIKDTTTISAISHLVRITIIVISALIAMQTLGVKINTLLTFGGIGGIAIGFAAKDTIANLIGGLMIYWDRPFSVGDWVRSPDRELEGTVENIGWRLTRIRTLDQRPLYVPNGIFSTIVLENPARMMNRRIKTVVGLRYQDAAKIPVILADFTQMLQQHEGIDTNLTFYANFVEFGASALNIMLYAFTKTTDLKEFQTVQQDIFLRIIDIISKHGAECAYPTTALVFEEKVK